jgi:hypothetical protein
MSTHLIQDGAIGRFGSLSSFNLEVKAQAFQGIKA